MIKVENVSKRYSKIPVIEHIYLTVSRGEIRGLIGNNGAGKTTLIKCITGIYKPDDGSVLYDDEKIYDNPDVKHKVGYVSDNCGYLGRYSVSGMVRLYENYYPNFNKEKFNTLNEEFGLSLKSKVKNLSKGQKMRLGFMLELSKQPEYLILDEPTSGLDPVAKSKFMEILVQEVEKGNIGVLISSHNLGDLEKLCDTITLIEDGKVTNNTNVDDLKEQFVKLQVVIPGGIDSSKLNLPNIVNVSNVGSVYTIIIDNYDKMTEEWLKSKGAELIEVIDMGLEELYVSSQSRKGAEQNEKMA
ncbi:MAG: ABC transporter ATP-binding protein [Lachnospiraceae bacterium]|nr:ABC transporter ATP-binding protein [Lachnospiraceae bacterium]